MSKYIHLHDDEDDDDDDDGSSRIGEEKQRRPKKSTRKQHHSPIYKGFCTQFSSESRGLRIMLLPSISTPSFSTRLRSNNNNSPIAMRSPSSSSSSKTMFLKREDSNASEKEKPPHRSSHNNFYTTGQAFALAALCASVAAVVTLLIAMSSLSQSSLWEDSLYADQMVASTTRSIISRRRVRSHNNNNNNNAMTEQQHTFRRDLESYDNTAQPLPTRAVLVSNVGRQVQGMASAAPVGGNRNKSPFVALPEPQVDPNSPRPHIAWLMSFPNSGTSFTLHMTREASNCTTATNYALEGDIRDQPSVPAIEGPAGQNGPFLELIRDRHTNIPSTILTKTHCKGICARDDCGPWGGIETVRSFLMGCLSGVKAVEKEGQIVTEKVTYDASLVKKAIHIFRHPLDNVVARFHLDYHDQPLLGNTKFTKQFPRNATGFRRWCAQDDKTKFFLESRYTDDKMRDLMQSIPCMNEFYRYVQWHNLAFDTSRYLNLPTMLLHYHEYSENLKATSDRVLDWLELPRVAPGEPFHTGKVYRHYYSLEQRRAIRAFLKEFASAETWEQLKEYDFEMQTEAAVS